MTEHVIIELHKGKNAWLTAGAFAFVALGGYLLTIDPAVIEQQRRFNNPTVLYSLAVVCMVFFAACGVVGVKKLLSKSPGLELTPEGLIDHSCGGPLGLFLGKTLWALANTKCIRRGLYRTTCAIRSLMLSVVTCCNAWPIAPIYRCGARRLPSRPLV